MAVGLFYRGVRGLVRGALGVFYRDIEVTGAEHLDAGAPTILACNHPNSIIDPLLLSVFEDRQVSFCARDGLFKIPGFGQLLRAVGAIPLQRRSDHAGGAVDNAGAFSACRGVLLDGGVLAIFPEGKTHSRMRVEPLKTGTARIALDAVAAWRALGRPVAGPADDSDAMDIDIEAAPRTLRIVPVGITYLVRHAFLSDVHVAIGAPIDPAAIGEAMRGQPEVEIVRAITGRVEASLRDLALHIDEEEDERFIAQVTAMVAGIRADEGLDRGGQSPAERTALARRVLDAHRWMKETDPIRTARVRVRFEGYMEERQRLGLGGERAAFQHRGERRQPLSGARWVTFFLVGAPFALYGLAISLVPYGLLRASLWLSRLPTFRVALFKLLGGIVVFGVCWAAMIAAVAMTLDPAAAAVFGVSLIPSAFFAQRFATETRLHRLQLRGGSLARRLRMARLRSERRALSEELSELRRLYLLHLGEKAPPPES